MSVEHSNPNQEPGTGEFTPAFNPDQPKNLGQTEIPGPRQSGDASTVAASSGPGDNEHHSTAAETTTRPHHERANRFTDLLRKGRRHKQAYTLGATVAAGLVAVGAVVLTNGNDDRDEARLTPPAAVSESFTPSTKEIIPPSATTTTEVAATTETVPVKYVEKIENIAIRPGADVILPQRGETPQQTLDNIATTLTMIANSKDRYGEWRTDLLGQFVQQGQDGHVILTDLIGRLRELSEIPPASRVQPHIQFEIKATGAENGVTAYPRGAVIPVEVAGYVVTPKGAIVDTVRPHAVDTLMFDVQEDRALPGGSQSGLVVRNLVSSTE